MLRQGILATRSLWLGAGQLQGKYVSKEGQQPDNTLKYVLSNYATNFEAPVYSSESARNLAVQVGSYHLNHADNGQEDIPVKETRQSQSSTLLLSQNEAPIDDFVRQFKEFCF